VGDFGNVIFSVIAFYIAINLFFILVLVVIIRAIFSIDTQIKLLKSINTELKKNDSIIKLLEDIKYEFKKDKREKCQCCSSMVPVGGLIKLDSGQMVCDKCIVALKSA